MKPTTRRDFLKGVSTGAAALALSRLLPAAAGEAKAVSLAGRRPNIIFILTDDQGYGDAACLGNPVLRTPNLDRMHSQGVRFVDHHVSPTCSPTRCSIMTGRHEFKSGVTHTIQERERMSLKATTLAQVLQGAGYATGIFGKWHLGDEAAYQPGRRGFDEVFIHGGGGIGQTFAGSCGDVPGNTYFDPCILHNGTFEKTRGFCTDVFFAQALQWIEQVKGKDNKPFFAYIPTNAAHAPLSCPEKYEAMYKGQPANVAKFFGMLTNIDDNLGQLFAKLAQWGIDKDTLVVYMNDNGGTAGVPIYNAGMRSHKGTPYNGGTRAMGFFRWPGTLEAGDVNRLTAHIDLFPTFAELAGAKIPASVKLDGYSLLPLLADRAAAWPDRYLFTHVGRWAKGQAAQSKYAQCSVRHGQYNMVCTRKQKGAWELYDLQADPGEKNDLAAAHPEIVKDMQQAYDKWWEEILPCLENEDATGPAVNPFKELYWKQYGGPGPNNVPPDGAAPAGKRNKRKQA